MEFSVADKLPPSIFLPLLSSYALFSQSQPPPTSVGSLFPALCATWLPTVPSDSSCPGTITSQPRSTPRLQAVLFLSTAPFLLGSQVKNWLWNCHDLQLNIGQLCLEALTEATRVCIFCFVGRLDCVITPTDVGTFLVGEASSHYSISPFPIALT